MRLIDWGVQVLQRGVVEVQRRPWLLRKGLGVATRVLPRPLAQHFVVSADGVRETFARPEDFWMGYLNAPKLKLGRFLLGMDPPYRDYFREKQATVATLTHLPEQISRFASVEAELVAEQLARALQQGGTLELATSYAEPVYTRALAHCFGVPSQGEVCPRFEPFPNREPLARYIQIFGSTIGSDHPAPGGLEARAVDAAPWFNKHLQAAVRAHREGKIDKLLPKAAGVTLAPADTVMGQLLQQAPFEDGDAGVVRCVAGMMSASAGFPRAFASVLHELLARPEHLRGFAVAVLAQDEARVHGYVREALRFRPVFPVLVRHCPFKTKLKASGAAFGNSQTVPFYPVAAMFDPLRVDHPEVFNPQRPESVYFLFGGEPRECIGKPMMMKLFMPLFSSLFRYLPRLLDARPGRFKYDGPAVKAYELQLGAAAPGELVPLRREVRPEPEFAPVAAVARVSMVEADSEPDLQPTAAPVQAAMAAAASGAPPDLAE